MLDWQVGQLRLTLFRAKPIETVAPLWETLAGEKPERVDSQPRANIIIEEGNTVLGYLTHTSNPIRIDWTLVPSQEQQKEATFFPSIGPLLETKEQFINIMSNWFSSYNVPEINRIALGSVSLIIKENRESAYKLLSELLSSFVKIDIENSTDLFYQINRPIQSTVESDLMINRLSKWGTTHSKAVGLFLGEKVDVIPETRDNIAVRLETDINTHQSNTNIFEKEKLIPLLRELNSYTDQISKEGDKYYGSH